MVSIIYNGYPKSFKYEPIANVQAPKQTFLVLSTVYLTYYPSYDLAAGKWTWIKSLKNP